MMLTTSNRFTISNITKAVLPEVILHKHLSTKHQLFQHSERTGRYKQGGCESHTGYVHLVDCSVIGARIDDLLASSRAAKKKIQSPGEKALNVRAGWKGNMQLQLWLAHLDLILKQYSYCNHKQGIEGWANDFSSKCEAMRQKCIKKVLIRKHFELQLLLN